MAKNSNIEWTDSTVNFWWGCTKVGPGCDHCYAETWSRRTGGNIWGGGVPRRKIKSAVALLHRLDNDYSRWAADHEIAGHHQTSRQRVFIQSMSDLFDLEVPLEWFSEAWQTIEQCNRLHIQIVTKRISAVEKRLAAIGVTTWPKHAGLMITVCNQAEADRDIPRLLALKAKLGIPWVGLSMEPILGHARILKYLYPLCDRCAPWETPCRTGCENCTNVDWVIVGGESGSHARPMHPDWVRSIREQCITARVPFFFKQWGEFGQEYYPNPPPKIQYAMTKDGVCYAPEDIAFPDGKRRGEAIRAEAQTKSPTMIYRVGKARAGRLLDSVEHNDMPRAFL